MHAQGFQVLVDTDNGFGGLATELLEGLADTYGKKTVMVMGLGDARPLAVVRFCRQDVRSNCRRAQQRMSSCLEELSFSWLLELVARVFFSGPIVQTVFLWPLESAGKR